MNSIVKGNSLQVASNVRQYMEKGIVQFDKLLAISLHGRIPNLTHVYGLEKVHALLTALLADFCNSLNLIRPMSQEQIVQCAYEMMLSSEEDQLSIEDCVLFFKGAKEGKYGKILDRMDQQTVFQLLEEYRQERHRQFLRIKDEKHAALKAMGPTERTMQPDPIKDAMVSLGGKISNLKDQLKEQREINRMQKFSKE